ncbi:acyl-CoA-binding domain-containing protein 5 [Nymphalis io]|uniref:acyl-CoA-binding domain-containing protein 5 n=1 Tax=Inachis io TaxID=171585 RepID=UPI00216AADA4|nr:acyl-CoA-binding domain-containing protein 5 [Nymphalis io]XP_050358932.1 acyl-CoA-binding domain-containing protein 5 [Nymphalis io]
MSLEEKFKAAVNVIKSLPKNGSYQPSNDIMLKFYSFYKQALEGPCKKSKPGFWDIVNRTKWDAWKSLGDMPSEEAMQLYVNELHKIVETMSYNKDVASFLLVSDTEDGFPSADLQLVAGDIIERCRNDSLQNSPLYSRSDSGSSSPTHRIRHDSDDEFIDTVDVAVNETDPVHTLNRHRLSNGHAHQITSQLTYLKVLEHLPGVLARLEADVAALRKAVEGDRMILDQVSRGWRWPWQELSPPTLILIAVWPFIAYRIASRLQRRNT